MAADVLLRKLKAGEEKIKNLAKKKRARLKAIGLSCGDNLDTIHTSHLM